LRFHIPDKWTVECACKRCRKDTVFAKVYIDKSCAVLECLSLDNLGFGEADVLQEETILEGLLLDDAYLGIVNLLDIFVKAAYQPLGA